MTIEILPMLLSNKEYDLNKVNFDNKRISDKRDGVRGETDNTGILGRSLKKPRNLKIQEYFREVYENLPDGVLLEGEIYCDGIPCEEMSGICNSLDKDIPLGTKIYLFGMYDSNLTFDDRYVMLDNMTEMYCKGDRWEVVDQYRVKSAEEAEAFYLNCLEKGYEGAVLMTGDAKYKEDRVTIKQDIGYKMVPMATTDLLIIGVTERETNTNESFKNELGKSTKRNTVDAKESTGMAACFICKDGELETKVTIGGSEESRREIWSNKERYTGCYAVVKSKDYGKKDRLRQPRLKGIKNSVEK